MSIINLFLFSEAGWLMLLGRFGVLLAASALMTFLVAFILLLITKKKTNEVGFSNWFKVCFLWGINATLLMLGVIVILTLRENGLYYFTWASFSWSWYCGWLLMVPEFLLFAGWIIVYWVLNSLIKKSINY